MASIIVLGLGQGAAYPTFWCYSPKANWGCFLQDLCFHLPSCQPFHCFCSSFFYFWNDEGLYPVGAVLETVLRVFFVCFKN